MAEFRPSTPSTTSLLDRQHGFTLIELVMVVLIIGILFGLFYRGSSTVLYWRQQGALREIRELMQFLHYQAVADQAFYRLEFDLEKNSYRVGALRPEYEEDDRLAEISQDAGRISLELAAYLNPVLGSTHTMIPPPAIRHCLRVSFSQMICR